MSNEINIEIGTIVKDLENKLGEIDKGFKDTAKNQEKVMNDSFASIGKVGDDMFKKLKTAFVGYISARAVKGFSKIIIEGAKAQAYQENVTRNLTSALKSAGEEIDSVLPKFHNLSNDISRVSDVGNETVEMMGAKFVRSLGDSKLAMEQLSIASNISRVSMESFEGVSNSIYRTLETGNANALRKYIGGTELLTEKLQKANTTQERHKLILQSLKKEYGEVELTAQDMMGSLNNAFGDWQKAIGGGAEGSEAMKNALESLVFLLDNSLIPLTETFFNDWWFGVNRVVNLMDKVLGSFVEDDVKEIDVLEDAKGRLHSKLIEAQLTGNDELVETLTQAISRAEIQIQERDDRILQEKNKAEQEKLNVVKNSEKTQTKIIEDKFNGLSQQVINELIITRNREEYKEKVAQDRREQLLKQHYNKKIQQENSYHNYNIGMTKSYHNRLEEKQQEHNDKIFSEIQRIENFEKTYSIWADTTIGIHNTWANESLNMFGKMSSSIGSLAGGLKGVGDIANFSPKLMAGLGIASTTAGLLTHFFGRDKKDSSDDILKQQQTNTARERTAQVRSTSPDTVNNYWNWSINGTFVDDRGLEKVTKEKIIPLIAKTEQKKYIG